MKLWRRWRTLLGFRKGIERIVTDIAARFKPRRRVRKRKSLAQRRMILKFSSSLGSNIRPLHFFSIHSISIMHIVMSLGIVPFAIGGRVRGIYFSIIGWRGSSTIFIVKSRRWRGRPSRRHVVLSAPFIVDQNCVSFRGLFEGFGFLAAAVVTIRVQRQGEFAIGRLDLMGCGRSMKYGY